MEALQSWRGYVGAGGYHVIGTSIFVIYVVLYLYYMMYSNIVKELGFQYIEHGILRYDFVYDITMYLF